MSYFYTEPFHKRKAQKYQKVYNSNGKIFLNKEGGSGNPNFCEILVITKIFLAAVKIIYCKMYERYQTAGREASSQGDNL